MMTNIRYTKDTEGFWEQREQAKAALRKEQSSPPEKKKIQQRLDANVRSLDNARIVSFKT